MRRRAAGMRWEALLKATRKGCHLEGQQLLKAAMAAGEAAAAHQGPEAVHRARRRAARITEACQRYAKEPPEELPSLGAEHQEAGTGPPAGVAPGGAAEFRALYARQLGAM
ncbi:uncharacterized protein LOC142356080 [Convolutriloba macropyga]|uniref:uncharacterized protein LOC142356080 n=1 Tax=Convolutriloba macropyga TaxID=536237 RepID=UPI003F52494A